MIDWNDPLDEFKKKKEALFSAELGKIGHAAERGGPVNKVQKEQGEHSEQVMYANKMKHEPFKKKLTEVGIGLTVAAATNPELGRGLQRMFTGNPIENIKDMALRNKLMNIHKRSMLISKKEQLDWAEENLRTLPDHPVFTTEQQKLNFYNNQLNNVKERYSRENMYLSALDATNEAMVETQAMRVVNKELDKIIKESTKKFFGK